MNSWNDILQYIVLSYVISRSKKLSPKYRDARSQSFHHSMDARRREVMEKLILKYMKCIET